VKISYCAISNLIIIKVVERTEGSIFK